MSNFKLAPHIKCGLQLLQNSTAISTDIFKQILELALCNILGKNDPINFSLLCKSKPDVLKEFYAAILNFIVQLVRHDVTVEKVQNYCTEMLRFNSASVEIFSEFYAKNKASVKAKLELFSTDVPAIIDIQWKLDYIVKASEMARIDTAPIYRIQMLTNVFDTTLNETVQKSIVFHCSVLELTELVSKLKDIQRHLERCALT